MYGLDDGENPSLFTVAGILVTLMLGGGVFYLLYSALSPPAPLAETPLPMTATPPTRRTATAEVRVTSSTQSVRLVASPTLDRLPSTSTVVTSPTAAATSSPLPATRQSQASIRPTPAPIYLRVDTGGARLSIRSQPGPNSPVLEFVPDNGTVLFLGQTRTSDGVRWRRVRTLGRGTDGWASAEFLKPER